MNNGSSSSCGSLELQIACHCHAEHPATWENTVFGNTSVCPSVMVTLKVSGRPREIRQSVAVRAPVVRHRHPISGTVAALLTSMDF
jgi:hypothetical protein